MGYNVDLTNIEDRVTRGGREIDTIKYTIEGITEEALEEVVDKALKE